MQEQRFITAADLRQLGYAPVAEVSQVVIELVQGQLGTLTEQKQGELLSQWSRLHAMYDKVIADA